MFTNTRPRTRILQALLFLCGPALAISSGADPIGRSTAGVENVRVVDLNTTFRAFYANGIRSDCFEAHVPSGTLKLDVVVPGGTIAEPRLDFHGQADMEPEERRASFSYIERSAARLLLDIRAPGSYSFCVATQDPLLKLEEYKLTNVYVDSFDRKSGDPDEDEPDPESFTFGCGLKSGDPDEDEPDPESLTFGCGLKSGDPDEDEPDPESLTFGCGGAVDLADARDRRLRDILDEICRSGEVDDHGDTFACATTLDIGHAVAGEIRNEWGDDSDVFVFMLTEFRTVEIATTGWTDTFGSLYDRSGHRLGSDDDSGSGNNLRMAKTLGPGWYLVRVEGRNRSEGVYHLQVDALR